MTNFSKVLTAGTAAVLVVGILAVADARNKLSRCDNFEYWLAHRAWCEAAARIGIRRHPVRRAAVEVGESPQYVTVTRDRQANTNVGPADPYIALQSPEDVARSPEVGSWLGWKPGLLDLGYVHPPIYGQASSAEVRKARRHVQSRVVEPAADLSVCPRGREQSGLCERQVGSH